MCPYMVGEENRGGGLPREELPELIGTNAAGEVLIQAAEGFLDVSELLGYFLAEACHCRCVDSFRQVRPGQSPSVAYLSRDESRWSQRIVWLWWNL